MSLSSIRMRPTRFTSEEVEACVGGIGARKAGMPGLREHDGLLRENWYIAGLSKDLSASVSGLLSTVVYETPMVIYRDPKGDLQAVIDRCLHRGAKLSEGACAGGQLRCPYHGWTYGAGGRLCEVPSEGPLAKREAAAVSEKAWRLSSFPVSEQDGVIWVWMGEGAPASGPSWRFPHAGESEWTGYFMVTDFHNEVTHLVENFMDVPHTVYVHDKWFRNRREIKVPITVELGRSNRQAAGQPGGQAADQPRVLVTYDQPGDSIGFSSKVLNPDGHPMVHTDEFIFPNITRVDYRFGDRGYVINSQCTPMGRYHTRVYTWIAYRLFPGVIGRMVHRFLARPMAFYTRQVIEQDVDIMKNQGANLLRLDEQGAGLPFRSTAADELHIAIERLRELGRSGDERLKNIAWTKEREIWI